jgi:hypothetical protein
MEIFKMFLINILPIKQVLGNLNLLDINFYSWIFCLFNAIGVCAPVQSPEKGNFIDLKENQKGVGWGTISRVGV